MGMGSRDFRRASFEGKFEEVGSDRWQAPFHQEPEGSRILSELRGSSDSPCGSVGRRPRGGGGDMVRESKAGSGSEPDLRSPSGDRSHSQRQADQEDFCLAFLEQRKSSYDDSSTVSVRRLWAAVLSMAFRDFSRGNQKERQGVMRWLETEHFSDVCGWAGVEEPLVRERFKWLSEVPIDMRPKVFREISLLRPRARK